MRCSKIMFDKETSVRLLALDASSASFVQRRPDGISAHEEIHQEFWLRDFRPKTELAV